MPRSACTAFGVMPPLALMACSMNSFARVPVSVGQIVSFQQECVQRYAQRCRYRDHVIDIQAALALLDP